MISQNTKILAIASFLTIFVGFGFLWFGLQSNTQILPTPSPARILLVESSPVATSSAVAESDSAVVGVESEKVKVTRVIDGDTIEIEGGLKVRLLGIDTPETKDPRKSVQCFGKEAANETRRLIQGKYVILEKDVSETDKYQRLLRYVFLPLEDGRVLFVNDYLLREGFARILNYPPDVKFAEQFFKAQENAKREDLGLWGACVGN